MRCSEYAINCTDGMVRDREADGMLRGTTGLWGEGGEIV